jgi:hypothetical protein
MAFTLSWTAPEFEHRERDVSWYWISIIIAAGLIAFAVWQKDFLFGIFIVAAEMLIIVWANRTPRIVSFTLTDKALSVGDHKYHLLGEFESFSTDDGGGADGAYADVFWYSKNKLRTPLHIMIPKDQLESLRKNLRPLLPEVKHDPSVIDSIEKIIGF